MQADQTRSFLTRPLNAGARHKDFSILEHGEACERIAGQQPTLANTMLIEQHQFCDPSVLRVLAMKILRDEELAAGSQRSRLDPSSQFGQDSGLRHGNLAIGYPNLALEIQETNARGRVVKTHGEPLPLLAFHDAIVEQFNFNGFFRFTRRERESARARNKIDPWDCSFVCSPVSVAVEYATVTAVLIFSRRWIGIRTAQSHSTERIEVFVKPTLSS